MKTETLTELVVDKTDGVATLTLNRPAALNAYSTETLQALASAVRDASFDDSIAVIVLTGTGTRAFCTGGDVKEYVQRYVRRPHDYWKYMNLFRDALEAILRAGKPTIARLNGMAVGGGNELQLACDLTFAAEHAWIGQVGTSVGSVACGGATQWLPVTVGAKRAAEILLLNPRLPARKAAEIGLINEAVPSVRCGDRLISGASAEETRKALKEEEGYRIDLGPLDDRIGEIIASLKEKFPECVRYTRQQMNFWKELVWSQTIGHAADWLALHFACVEPGEGMRAFVEKRKPDVADLRARLARGDGADWHWGPPAASCPHCKAKNLPEAFTYCGACGREL